MSPFGGGSVSARRWTMAAADVINAGNVEVRIPAQ
jgi:hypothetical protein